MNLLKNIFGTNEVQVKTYQDFWTWFENNEKTFFKIVKSGKNIQRDFFKKLSPKLAELKDGIFYLTGMYDENTAELILTPDGTVKNIVFVEELINFAPIIPGWRFTSLKPSIDLKNVCINMSGYIFDSESLFFYSNEYSKYPDEIDITIIHKNYKEEDKSAITNGTFIFLDNYLGELNFVTKIDNVKVIGKNQAEKELIPIEKLKSFINWREKEFIEKYEGKRYDTENDAYASLEAELKNGKPLIAVVNTTLLEWESKASHPWILNIAVKYNGEDNNGMPDNATYELLNKFEDELMIELKDFDGYLNIGRETSDSIREIFFACKDFRKPSKILFEKIKHYTNILEIDYDIYKDKYWKSLDRFRPI
jgi:hypothetical protein